MDHSLALEDKVAGAEVAARRRDADMIARPNGLAAQTTVGAEHSKELDRVEMAITAVNKTLNPSLWAAARKTPAAARAVAEIMKALVDLHRERDSIEEQVGR